MTHSWVSFISPMTTLTTTLLSTAVWNPCHRTFQAHLLLLRLGTWLSGIFPWNPPAWPWSSIIPRFHLVAKFPSVLRDWGGFNPKGRVGAAVAMLLCSLAAWVDDCGGGSNSAILSHLRTFLLFWVINPTFWHSSQGWQIRSRITVDQRNSHNTIDFILYSISPKRLRNSCRSSGRWLFGVCQLRDFFI